MRSEQNSIMSVTRRIAGSIGKHHSFWAMYSLRMSVWIVPERLGGHPLMLRRDHVERKHHGGRSVDRHRGRNVPHGNPTEERLHVVKGVDGDPLAADLAQR